MSQTHPLDFLISVLLVAAGYTALTIWVANIAWALRVKNKRLAGALGILPPALLIIAIYAFRYPAIAAIGPLVYIVVFAVATLVLIKSMAPGNPIFPLRETKSSTIHLVLISMSALFVVPLVWMMSCSVKENSQLSKFPPEWIPSQQNRVMYNGHSAGVVTVKQLGKDVTGITYHIDEHGYYAAVVPVTIAGDVATPAPGAQFVTLKPGEFTQVRHNQALWKNYPDALAFLPPSSHFGIANLENTLIICFLSVIGTVLSSSMVAYGFARLKWPGRDWVFGILLATMMLPDAVTMMPRFLIFRELGWVDTLRPLWVPSFFASAFSVFLLRQFFMGIPKELEDAAKIDGCSYLRTYWSVMMPLVKPALAAVTIMTFLNTWKDFMGPLIYISSPEKMPLSYVLQLYNSAHGSSPELLMAATTMVMLPVLILFFFTQRYFIEGISLTGLGGR